MEEMKARELQDLKTKVEILHRFWFEVTTGKRGDGLTADLINKIFGWGTQLEPDELPWDWEDDEGTKRELANIEDITDEDTGDSKTAEGRQIATLYKLAGEYLTLLEWSQDPEMDEQAIEEHIGYLLEEIGTKVDAYATVMSEIRGRMDTFDREISRLGECRKAMDKTFKRMTDRLKDAMEAMGVKQIEGKLYTAKLKGNGGDQPMQITGDVPDSFTRVTVEPDKTKIKDALKKGEKLDFAELLPRGKHIEIKGVTDKR